MFRLLINKNFLFKDTLAYGWYPIHHRFLGKVWLHPVIFERLSVTTLLTQGWESGLKKQEIYVRDSKRHKAVKQLLLSLYFKAKVDPTFLDPRWSYSFYIFDDAATEHYRPYLPVGECRISCEICFGKFIPK